MVRTEIGECAIIHNNVTYEFRPSIKNIRKICSPNEMADFYADIAGVIEAKIVTASKYALEKAIVSYQKELRSKIANVLLSCCDTDCSKLLDDEESAKTMTLKHIAMSLLNNGVIGKPPKSTSKESKEKRSVIDVYEYADIAEAHLGIAYPLSENLTKTELDRKLSVKFPEEKKPSSNAPSDDDYYEAMAFLDKVNAKRAK